MSVVLFFVAWLFIGWLAWRFFIWWWMENDNMTRKEGAILDVILDAWYAAKIGAAR